jgi:hypothetical protein
VIGWIKNSLMYPAGGRIEPDEDEGKNFKLICRFANDDTDFLVYVMAEVRGWIVLGVIMVFWLLGSTLGNLTGTAEVATGGRASAVLRNPEVLVAAGLFTKILAIVFAVWFFRNASALTRMKYIIGRVVLRRRGIRPARQRRLARKHRPKAVPD